MRVLALIACISFLFACAQPALLKQRSLLRQDASWIRIRHSGEVDKPVPTTWITTAHIVRFNLSDLPQEAVLSPSDYEFVLQNMRSFAATMPNLNSYPIEYGTFEVTESANGVERLIFVISKPETCDFLKAIVGNQSSDDLDELREMTSRIGRIIACTGAAA